MATFSFITEFLGGTYISQHEAPDVHRACSVWRDHLVEERPFADLDAVLFSNEFDFYIDFMPPVAMDNLKHIWAFGFAYAPKKSVNTTIVQTEIAVVGVKNVSSALG